MALERRAFRKRNTARELGSELWGFGIGRARFAVECKCTDGACDCQDSIAWISKAGGS